MLALERIKEVATKVGFDLCGVVAATALREDAERFSRWIEAGNQATLGYLERNREKRFDPRLLVEGAQTVVVCAINYKNGVSEGYPTGHRAKVASYACKADYHTTLKAMLNEMMVLLKADCPTLSGRAFVDSAPVAEKRWAVEAGLGWIGRQSLLITPEYGSFVHLGELIINQACDRYDTPFEGSRCGTCRACVEACPSGAILDGERMIDARKCIACHTIEAEQGQSIDLDGWIFGCDACQTCCPHNRRTPHYRAAICTPLFDPRTLAPADWQRMSDEEFSTRFRSTPLTRSGLVRLQANAKFKGH